MKLFNLKKKVARGFTLIEVLLVVGFIALAGIGVYVVYNKVQTGNAANTEARNIDTLRAGVKNIYGGQVNYNGLTETVLLNARVVPDNMRDGSTGTSIFNTFGGLVTIAPVAFNGGTNNAFSITYAKVPADVCAKLVTTGGNGFNRVVVGTTTVKDTSASTGNTLNVAGTATACAADTGAGLTLVFTSL